MANQSVYTFSDIFQVEFKSGEEPVKLSQIVIPKIQRDYAQGRSTAEAVRIRPKFLDALLKAVEGAPIALDFIYGNIDDRGIMTPLDGQQRLTTLFLLYWFAAKHGKVDSTEYAFLNCFSYENRPSSRDFCKQLVSFDPSFTGRLSDEIIDQEWFPLDWKHDPTIDAMLTMIDAIQERFSAVDALWGKLMGGKISFYFLAVKDMGLSDDIYIKMNSRGKPLTQFEHFKAEFEHALHETDEPVAKRIIDKIDNQWTDLLWPYKNDNNVIDDAFLRYFKFICDIICYKHDASPKITDEFELIKEFFTGENTKDNISLLESYFDCWYKIAKPNTPLNEFFASYISYSHESGKIKIENRYAIDLLEDCLRNYGEINSGHNRKFPLSRTILLYAFITYLLHVESIKKEQFAERLRHVHNLILNSTDEISDSETRTGGNRMPAILEQVAHLVLQGTLLPEEQIANNFNIHQLSEERLKIDWIPNHPQDVETLYALEDHALLHGQIGIIGLENIHLAPRFESLFGCNIDLVDRALLTIGNYGRQESNGWRWQFGSKNESSWEFLFHKNSAKHFDSCRNTLLQLLKQCKNFTDEYLESLCAAYLTQCENNRSFTWRYYRIKYDSFRNTGTGKYCFYDYDTAPYRCLLMKTRAYISSNSYDPYLFEIDSEHISADDYGQILRYDGYSVSNENSSFRITSDQSDPAEILKEIPIPQSEDGIDKVDRILFGKEALAAFRRNPTSGPGK